MKNKIYVLVAVFCLVFGLFVYKQYSNVNKNNQIVSENSNKSVSDNTKTSEEKNTNSENKNGSASNTASNINLEELEASTGINLQDLKKENKPIIIEFSQENCAPCKMLHPILEKVHSEYKGKVIVKSVDIRKFQEFTNDFPVRVTPTLFYFNSDGTPFVPSDDLAKKVNHVAYKDKKSSEVVFSGSEGVVQYDDFISMIKEMGVNAR